jgi:hypothetical protein
MLLSRILNQDYFTANRGSTIVPDRAAKHIGSGRMISAITEYAKSGVNWMHEDGVARSVSQISFSRVWTGLSVGYQTIHYFRSKR